MKVEIESGGLEVTGRLFLQSDGIHIFLEKVFKRYRLRCPIEEESIDVIRDAGLDPERISSSDYNRVLQRMAELCFGSPARESVQSDSEPAGDSSTASPGSRPKCTRMDDVQAKAQLPLHVIPSM